jgi:hypothetical protein
LLSWSPVAIANQVIIIELLYSSAGIRGILFFKTSEKKSVLEGEKINASGSLINRSRTFQKNDFSNSNGKQEMWAAVASISLKTGTARRKITPIIKLLPHACRLE